MTQARPVGRLTQVTRDRLSKRDHYRLQINLDKQTVAFGYYALAHYYPREVVASIRNYLLDQLEQNQIKVDAEFAASLQTYLDCWIDPSDPELQGSARSFYQGLGWTPPPTSQ